MVQGGSLMAKSKRSIEYVLLILLDVVVVHILSYQKNLKTQSLV